MQFVLKLVEGGYIPDFATYWGIRRLCDQRKAELDAEPSADNLKRMMAEMTRLDVVAEDVDLANDQHYELPPSFMQACLGKHLKYSCCYYDGGATTLDEAEAAALQLTCERAQLADGQDVLELGCGWGSLTLWMGANYPKSRITAVSNSAPQREFITAQARERGITNVTVITCDMNVFSPGSTFDRVVSVEMFEHMRNYALLLPRVSSWLKDSESRLFVHIFCHRSHTYFYDAASGDESDWMAKYFFSGGVMPAEKLYESFAPDANLKLKQRWQVNGTNYEKTSRHWLENLDRNKDKLLANDLKETYGEQDAYKWYIRWRMFYMACEAMFGMYEGKEWYVSHSLWSKAE